MSTSTEVPDPDNQELDSRIVTAVERYWNDHGIPILLSQLGNEDGGDIARRAREQAGGLATYQSVPGKRRHVNIAPNDNIR